MECARVGTINLHASLLPQLRGAAPIQWAIIHGLDASGVSTFSLQHAIDTGDVLLQERVAIVEADDAGALYEKLLHNGKALIVETLDRLVAGELIPRPQSTDQPLLEAPKLNRENTSINWSETADNVINKIRGLHPIPESLDPSILGISRCSKLTPWMQPTHCRPKDSPGMWP